MTPDHHRPDQQPLSLHGQPGVTSVHHHDLILLIGPHIGGGRSWQVRDGDAMLAWGSTAALSLPGGATFRPAVEQAQAAADAIVAARTPTASVPPIPAGSGVSVSLLYRSSNGDRWDVHHDPVAASGPVVRHTPNAASGGRATDTTLEVFATTTPAGPEHVAALEWLGEHRGACPGFNSG
ncbi:hypothetical protein [Rhizosaccharibacter radicis]|uniref:Uncharacterized protein n=1 Tax=Rhizosaccharibacter radicis TaxID=2782605 RepID=A0ABT1VTB5_9PROT|nr:hypothetical protein [Acetobacteraceae bacterium KSS12]